MTQKNQLRLQFRFSLWHIAIRCSDDPPICQRSQSRLGHELLNIYATVFFRERRIANMAVHGKTLSELPQWKENFIFILVYCSYCLISVLWIWIWISLDHDLFWSDPDPWKSPVRFSASESNWSPSCGKLRQIGEPVFTSMDDLLKEP
jgi:hypothetical protein